MTVVLVKLALVVIILMWMQVGDGPVDLALSKIIMEC